jgi:hypothetical protein
MIIQTAFSIFWQPYVMNRELRNLRQLARWPDRDDIRWSSGFRIFRKLIAHSTNVHHDRRR